MADNRRRAAATALTGYTLVAGGGAIRGHAIDQAHEAIGARTRMKPPAGAVYAAHQLRVPRRAAILRRFGLGTALVTVGAPAAAKGTYDLIRRRHDDVVKRRTPLVIEGVTGTGEALHEKTESLSSGAPMRVRAVPIGLGGASALTASLATHRVLDRLAKPRPKGLALRIHPAGRAALTAVAAVPGALATLPVSRRITRRSGYQVTPTGVRKGFRDAPRLWAVRAELPKQDLVALPSQGPGGRGWYKQLKHGKPGYRIEGRRLYAARHKGFPADPYGQVAKALPRRLPYPVNPPDLLPVVTRRRQFSQQLADTGQERARNLRVQTTRTVTDRLKAPPRSPASLPLAKAWQPKTYDPPDYRGRHVPVRRQRAAIYSSGALPLGIGAIASAKVAGAYAPPGHEHKTSVRQFTAGPAAGTAAGITAAHQLARRVDTSPTVRDATSEIHRAGQYVARTARRAMPQREAGPRAAKVLAAAQKARATVKDSRALRPFFGSPERAIASAVGYSIAKPVVGQLGGSWAMRRNQVDQRRYNAHHPVEKAATSQRERDQLARRKRLNAATSTITGMTGLGALTLLAAGKHPKLVPHAGALEHHRNSLLAVGAGVGGAGSLNFAGIQRREAKADAAPPPRIVISRKTVVDRERRNQPRSELIKFDRLRTDMHEHEARRLVRQYGGLSGPLPPGLSRDEKMRAYEARYVASGGKKVQRWQRRAEAAEVTRNAGLVGGAVSGAAWLAAGSPRGRAAGRILATHIPRARRVTAAGVKHAAERTAVGAATLGASAELAGEYARARRGRYTSAPGGVAASALRRMRAYTPGDNR